LVEILVYGAKIRCASCINAPSSEETASWLEAALGRVYDPHQFTIRYVDIYKPNTPEEEQFSKRVLEEDLWYPVVVMNQSIVTEGNPDLKLIYKKMDELQIPKLE
jgi:disulfide oxidoreductase YuzD